MWRTTERQRIGIFNGSHYEEMLEDICAFERYLSRNGILVRKFFLNLSKEEQAQRLIARLEEPQKNWKFSTADIQERKYWDAYVEAYEDMIRHTATPWAPWYAVPADHKWFSRLVVASAVVDALEGLNLSYPKLDANRSRELARTRKLLQQELHLY